MLASGYSFRLLSKKKIAELNHRPAPIENKQVVSDVESDSKKRSFLKLAGVVGVGALATTLIPKKAEALVFGSTPTSNTVGVKNAGNTRVNPATEDTLAGVKAQTDLLTFDAGSNPANLKVNVAGGDVGLQNAANVTINPATEDTLALIKSQTDKFKFSGDSLLTAGGSAASVVGLNDTTSTQINPATDDSVVYLRRIVKLMESQAVVDGSSRQRVNIDSFGTNGALVTGAGAGGAGIPRVTVSNDSTIGLVAGAAIIGSIANVAGQNQQMYQDVARNAFANGIRQNLVFS